MRINTNVSAIVSNNALQKAQDALSSSIQRLSSGYKINSSADDPAGCAISEKMRVQIRGLDQAKTKVTSIPTSANNDSSVASNIVSIAYTYRHNQI